MANRYMQQGIQSFVHKLTFIEGEFSVGSSGAVSGIKGSGISTVTRVSAGKYDLVLEDKFARFLSLDTALIEGGGATGVAAVNIASDPQASLVSATPKITIQCRSVADAAADPASGTVVKFGIMLRNSGLKGKGE